MKQKHQTFLPLLLHSKTIAILAAPFGYQSDSSKSFEYSQNGWHNPGDLFDPSSFAGSVHYDLRHHALFITGATFANSFDGVDAYLVNEEKNQLNDNDPNNDGFWWNDKEIGLHPHLGDPGIPGYSPKKSDCFYAVMALPVDTGNVGVGDEPKLVHSRRFGSENIDEACSAIDILFSDEVSTGEYIHGFEQSPGAGLPQQQPSPAGIPSPTYSAQGSSYKITSFPSSSPSSSTYEPTVTNWPSEAPSSATYDPTLSPVGSGGSNFFGGGRRSKQRSLPQEMRSVRLLMAGHVESPNGQDGYTVDALPPGDKRGGTHVYAFAQQVDVRLPPGFLSDDVLDSNEDAEYEYNLHEHADVFDPNDGATEDAWVNNPANDTTATTSSPTVTNFPSSSPSSATYEPTVTNWPSESPSSSTFEPTTFNAGVGGSVFGGGRNKNRNLLGTSDLAGKSVEQIQNEFAGIVTSGVDARALLDDQLPAYLNAVYPVSLVSDPTTKKHFYVASLASRQVDRNEQISNKGLNVDPTIGAGARWTDFIDIDYQQGTNDHFGGPIGRPNYGKDYMVVLKKVVIEGVSPACVDDSGRVNDCAGSYSPTEQILSSKGYNQENIAMKQEWCQEFAPEGGVDVRPSGLLFAPSGDPTGKDDTLVMVGTTSGFGNAFGMAGASNGYQSQDSTSGLDLDGFIMKIRTDTGVFAGHSKFDPVSSTFINMHSHRIQSLPMKDDIVAGLCSKPLLLSGNQEKMRHIYVVGSTESMLPGIANGLRDSTFLSNYPLRNGTKSMEAFLMKVDLDTLDPVWTVQVGAINNNMKGNAFGFGCAVTPDGDDIYLTGMVNQGGLVTDFSTEDFRGIPSNAHGGTDVFIASYKTTDGSRTFVRQVGSTRDDFPSRGSGCITADRLGNAILTGHTRGSLARKRDAAEYKFGDNGSYAAADIFVMSFDRATGNHVDIADDGVPPPDATSSGQQNTEKMDKKDAAIVGVVTISLCFVFVAIAGMGIVAYKVRSGKKKQEDRRFMSTNLRERRQSGKQSMPRRSTWGMKRQSSALSALQDLNVMVEVRQSASGGWHGLYDDDQLQVIEFGMSTGYKDNVVEQSLFMEDDLKEIEEASIDNYEIGDIDDVSDEDLIKAYNDAMAVDIEPENPDVQFTMAGLGSQPFLDEDHQIT